jgi:multiple sugar transport system substrate-binding protein
MLAGTAAVVAAALVLAGCGSGSGFSDTSAAGGGATSGGGGATSGGSSAELPSSTDPVRILIGSSGDAETAAVNKAVADWSATSGVKGEVIAANDLNQQLSQGFAAGSPPDLFYLSTDALPGYAKNGSLLAYGDMLANKGDFYPSLVENFTVDGTFYCAPKDFSTLALVINTKLWQAAGLTDADIPTTWDQLTTDAQKLTTGGTVGISFSSEYQRLGAFMAQAGGSLLNEDGTQAVVDSEQNVAALTYVQGLLTSGSAQFAKKIGAGWGGEAFGKELSAMTIEGNWIVGAMNADYPGVDYTVAELPAGSAGKGTLQFTNCWGIAADSKNQKNALALAEYLTSKDVQLEFSQAFGVMPSITTAAEEWKAANPKLAPFLAGVDYATGMPILDGWSAVVSDFNAQLESLDTGADVKGILTSTQANLEAIVG